MHEGKNHCCRTNLDNVSNLDNFLKVATLLQSTLAHPECHILLSSFG